jgi:hypothetical protein
MRIRAAGLAVAEEPALEGPEQLGEIEGSDTAEIDSVPIVLGDVVLHRLVCRLERVLELVALEEVVVVPGLVALAVLRVHRPAHGPERAGLALDPDDDALLAPLVVDPL